jgi:hypothetical protein
MAGAQYRHYPKTLLLRQVSMDARDKDNRAEQLAVVTTILDPSVDGVLIDRGVSVLRALGTSACARVEGNAATRSRSSFRRPLTADLPPKGTSSRKTA